ncbi:MAG: response regulator, partial [Alphaproteobacteria bacterium]
MAVYRQVERPPKAWITILLPRAISGRSIAKPTSAEHEPHGNGETILIVEDDANLREINAHVLDRLGYRPLQAEDAISALAILNETPEIAILFTDVVLPGGMSGVDLMDEALQQRPDLKVLFTSGYADNAIIDRGRIGSDFELIEKPFSKDILARKTHSFLE